MDALRIMFIFTMVTLFIGWFVFCLLDGFMAWGARDKTSLKPVFNIHIWLTVISGLLVIFYALFSCIDQGGRLSYLAMGLDIAVIIFYLIVSIILLLKYLKLNKTNSN